MRVLLSSIVAAVVVGLGGEGLLALIGDRPFDAGQAAASAGVVFLAVLITRMVLPE